MKRAFRARGSVGTCAVPPPAASDCATTSRTPRPRGQVAHARANVRRYRGRRADTSDPSQPPQDLRGPLLAGVFESGRQGPALGPCHLTSPPRRSSGVPRCTPVTGKLIARGRIELQPGLELIIEWGWHAEEEDEEGRAEENLEKNIDAKGFLEEELEEDRARKKGRGQEPQGTGREEASSGGFDSSSGDRFRPAPARHLLGRSASAGLTPLRDHRSLSSSRARQRAGSRCALRTRGALRRSPSRA